MTEESKSLDIDDWLEDLEESEPAKAEEVPTEMSQADIDALLGGTPPPSAAAPESGDFQELDQSDIDSLFAEASAPAPAPSAPAAGGSDDFQELDQSDIDSLLAEASTPAPAPSAPAAGGSGDFQELDQSDIDSLFAESSAPAPAPSAPAAGGSDDFQELNQSDIDGLFAASDGGGAAASDDPNAPSQDDVDQLFSPGGWNEADSGETVSFGEVLESQPTQADPSGATAPDPFGMSGSVAPDEDEFDFGELPDIPDETIGLDTGGRDDEDIFGGSATEAAGGDLAAFLNESTSTGVDAAKPANSPKKDKKPFVFPAFLASKKAMAAGAVCLLALLGAGGYWYLKGQGGVSPLPPKTQQLAATPAAKPPAAAPDPTPAAPPAVNTPPISNSAEIKMSKPGEALSVRLAATDKENSPLQYEIITPPKFGRLSGNAPELTYLPGKDFPGEDSFAFRVSDGQLQSEPARVRILGSVETASVKTATGPAPTDGTGASRPPAPKRTKVAARDVRLKTTSTSSLLIDWQKIWAEANRKPFPKDGSVEVFAEGLQGGTLKQLGRSSHRYEPDRQFAGKDVLRYRFSQAGVSSKLCNLTIEVKPGDLPPQLKLKALAARPYQAGESLVLDASQTWDDFPESMQFRWEQISGVPVHMEARNEEGSVVAFVVPSFFYREKDPHLVIRVSAIDQIGQQSSKDVRIPIASKRKSPLWNGLADDEDGVRIDLSGGGIEDRTAALSSPGPQ